jgi:hypothetical protein
MMKVLEQDPIYLSMIFKSSFWFIGSKLCINLYKCRNSILSSLLDFFTRVRPLNRESKCVCSLLVQGFERAVCTTRLEYMYTVLRFITLPDTRRVRNRHVVVTVIKMPIFLACIGKNSELRLMKSWRASSTCEKAFLRNILTSHLL